MYSNCGDWEFESPSRPGSDVGQVTFWQHASQHQGVKLVPGKCEEGMNQLIF